MVRLGRGRHDSASKTDVTMQTLDYTSAEPGTHFSRVRFWCAAAVALSVFPLIWMGGLVTSHGVGMSVPDWPNSYGYNMFLFPPSKWIGGIFYEHTHRLLGTLSGYLSVALVASAWAPGRRLGVRKVLGWFTGVTFAITVLLIATKIYLIQTQSASYEFIKSFSHIYVLTGSLALFSVLFWLARDREERRWVRWLTVVQLVAIIIQGTLGGLRVTEVNTTLAIIHGCFAQAFFALTGFTTLVMTRWWQGTPFLGDTRTSDAGRRAVKVGAVLVVLTFGQLVLGATMRHNGAGLAIPDLPLAYGKLLPPMDQASLDQANAIRAWDYHLDTRHDGQMSFTQMWLHFGHRVGALVVTGVVAVFAVQVFRNLRESRTATILAVTLCVLITIQFTLGVLSVYTGLVMDITALHVAFGAVTMVTATITTAAVARQYGIGKRAVVPKGVVAHKTQAWVTA